MGFLSTPSARRATRGHPHAQGADNISIHALREEGDPPLSTKLPQNNKISIHALREEGNAAMGTACAEVSFSIHALREEGDWL